MNGLVTNIQRYSVNDGYGIRTIVFLAGCSMSCIWCQNPETMGSGSPAVMFSRDSCSGCGACLEACPNGAIKATVEGIVYDREQCTHCFQCANVCYFGARKVSARRMTVDKAFSEVMKDESFYRNSNGGLTLSGGEPLMHPKFSRKLLQKVKEAGIHTAIETAGNVPGKNIVEVVPYTGLFLYDIKALDDEVHKKATGVSNRNTLINLEYLLVTGVEVIIRVPLIPGINDGEEFNRIADFVASKSSLKELHILPYHSIGLSKYDQLDMPYTANGLSENNDEEVIRCAAYASAKGLRVSVGGGGFAKRKAFSVKAST